MVSREVRCWRRRALTIPDPQLREDALCALDHKRTNTDGAALLWTVPHRRHAGLLCLLVAYEIMADFLDSTAERGAEAGLADSCRLHRSLVEAVDPSRAVTDHYRQHAWHDDGGYLHTIVCACRAGCGELSSYTRLRAALIQTATLARVQGLNHEPDPVRRERILRAWATQHPQARHMSWFEAAGAASAWLTVLALFALASVAGEEPPIPETYAAYYCGISLTAALLDNYVDRLEDRIGNRPNNLDHFASEDAAVRRLHALVGGSNREARTLWRGHAHAVISCCMIAMYLSKDSARAPELREHTQSIARAGGSLTRLLLPILRTWRIVYSQRNT